MTDTLVDGTTAAPDVTPRDGGITQVISGATHVESKGDAAPDPTGLRATLQKNTAAVSEKLAKAATDAAAETNATHKDVSRETPPEGMVRGPDGKFVAKAAAAADPAKAAAPADEPPSSWRTETKALWKEIDVRFGPEQGKLLKEELRKRENDFRTGLSAKDTEVSSIKSFHADLSPVLAPAIQQWQAQGIAPAQAVQHLVNLQQNFQRDPAGTIKWLAQAAKLDLAALATGATQEGGNTDPQLAPLLQQINGLQSELHQLKNGWASQTQAAATAEIQSVIDEKGADGQPVRPHFNDVFSDIKAEMQILRAQHPEWSARQTAMTAYDTAIWRNPETRQKMIEGTEAQRRAADEAQQRARAAELAAKNVRGGPPNALNGVPSTDLRGMLTARIGGLYGGNSRL